MAWNANTIQSRLNELYRTPWFNSNLFIPDRLNVSGLDYIADTNTYKEEGNGGQVLNNVITYISQNEPITIENTVLDNVTDTRVGIPNTCGCLSQLKSIGNINFQKLPLQISKFGSLEATSKENSSKSVKLTFLNDANMNLLSFYNAWRRIWYSTKFFGDSTENRSKTDILRSKISDNSKGSGEGFIRMKYIKLTSESETPIQLGELVLCGLIPVGISGLDSVGPGLDPQSKVSEVTIDCIYSQGYLYLSSSKQKLWLA